MRHLILTLFAVAIGFAGYSQSDDPLEHDSLITATVDFIDRHYLFEESNPYHHELTDSMYNLFREALNARLYAEGGIDIPDSLLWRIITVFGYGDYEDSPDTYRKYTWISIGYAILAMKYPGAGTHYYIDHAMLALNPDYFECDPDLMGSGIVSLHLLQMLIEYDRGTRGFDHRVSELRGWLEENPGIIYEGYHDEVEAMLTAWEVMDDE